MAHWLLKTEPDTYSFENLVADKHTLWTGVRNYQARNFLRDMKKGDRVVIFHTGKVKSAVGLGTVRENPVDDPTQPGEDWVAVDIAAGTALPSPVTLTAIKATRALASMAMLKLSRLSVSPLTASEYSTLIALAKSGR